jgi:hypothetical protein
MVYKEKNALKPGMGVTNTNIRNFTQNVQRSNPPVKPQTAPQNADIAHMKQPTNRSVNINQPSQQKHESPEANKDGKAPSPDLGLQ